LALSKLVARQPWRQGTSEYMALDRLLALAAGDLCAEGASVTVRLGGTVGGVFSLLLDITSARNLASALMGGMPYTDISSEMFDSGLCEASNIAACAFGIAVQGLSNAVIAPSVPELMYGELATSVRGIGKLFNSAMTVTGQFLSDKGDIAGRLVWFIDAGEEATLTSLLERSRDKRGG